MISIFRQHIEDSIKIPLHYVHLTQDESFPAACIRQTNGEATNVVGNRTNTKEIGFEISMYTYDYLELENLTILLDDTYDGESITIGDYGCQFRIRDIQDDSFPSAGSDDWIYEKEITMSVRYQKIN